MKSIVWIIISLCPFLAIEDSSHSTLINVGYKNRLMFVRTILNGIFINTNGGQNIIKMKKKTMYDVQWKYMPRPCQPQHCVLLFMHSFLFCFRIGVVCDFYTANYYIGNENRLYVVIYPFHFRRLWYRMMMPVSFISMMKYKWMKRIMAVNFWYRENCLDKKTKTMMKKIY